MPCWKFVGPDNTNVFLSNFRFLSSFFVMTKQSAYKMEGEEMDSAKGKFYGQFSSPVQKSSTSRSI